MVVNLYTVTNQSGCKVAYYLMGTYSSSTAHLDKYDRIQEIDIRRAHLLVPQEAGAMAKHSPSEQVPKDMQARFDEITQLTDSFSQAYLTVKPI